VTKGKTSRGKCPPFFPNGEYLRTDQIKSKIDHY